MPKRQPRRGLERRDGERSKSRRTERTTSRSPPRRTARCWICPMRRSRSSSRPPRRAGSSPLTPSMPCSSPRKCPPIRSRTPCLCCPTWALPWLRARTTRGAAAPDGEDGADNDDAVGRAVAIATPVPAITQARTEPAERTDDPVRMYLRDMGSVSCSRVRARSPSPSASRRAARR